MLGHAFSHDSALAIPEFLPEALISVSSLPIAVKTVAADALRLCACRGRECECGGKDCFLGCDMFHFTINFVLLFVEFGAKLDICWQLVKFLLL